MVSIVAGPIIFGFIFGLVIGSRIRRNEENSFRFTAGAIVAVFIASLMMAVDLGQFPFYSDLPIATGFISAVVGILIGSLLFGKFAKGDN